jgi:hypothetical protein
MITLSTRAVGLLAVLAVLGGCMSPRDRAMRQDPAYQAGYSDGCATASARGTDYRDGGRVRDEQLYATSKPYRAGWSSGYSICNNQFDPNPTPNTNGLPDQRPNP